jgi:outer membrane protein assembly factor BamB
MDRRFPEPEQPGSSGQPPWYPPPAWSEYPEQSGVSDRTLPPRRPAPERWVERRQARFPRMFLIWLVLAILLAGGTGSLVTALVLRSPLPVGPGRRTGTARPPTSPATVGAAPSPTLPGTPSGTLYAAEPGSIGRYTLPNTQQATWSLPIPYPDALLHLGNRLFFQNDQAPGGYLEAVNAATGQQIWQNTQYGGGFLLGSGNMLYDAACSDTLNSTGTTICNLYGINADTGAKVWAYPLNNGSAWIALQKGVIYIVSYTSYFAVNAATGTLLWQQNLFRYLDQNANMAPAVSGNVLSFASCNVTKQSRGLPGCYVYAFSTSNGAELWHMYTTTQIWATPAMMNGVVYAGSLSGTLYALDEQSGKQLWTATVGDSIGQILGEARSVYVETVSPDGQISQIEAFDASTHQPRWGQSQNSTGTSFRAPGQPVLLFASNHSISRARISGGIGSGVPFLLIHGLIYVEETPSAIDVLSTSNGSIVIQLNIAATDGFLLA